MTDESKPEPRVLWVALLYNWDTREKTISLLDDAGPLYGQTKKPGDHLYRAEFKLHPPSDDGSTSMEFQYLREEWETWEPKGADITTEAYIARRAYLLLSTGLVPPFSYGPDKPMQASNFPGQNFVDFSLSGVWYRITVELIGDSGGVHSDDCDDVGAICANLTEILNDCDGYNFGSRK